MSDQSPSQPRSAARPPRRWAGPLLLAALILMPIAILIGSNTESLTVSWAGFEWTAPGWMVMFAIFFGGALFGPVLGWALRSGGRSTGSSTQG
ncbi:MAG TPA: hypothetical protein VMM81_00635 [Acidimicrobiia bacterium]|nr:hypothetical protein [Acidimicrobiia bacterium]